MSCSSLWRGEVAARARILLQMALMLRKKESPPNPKQLSEATGLAADPMSFLPISSKISCGIARKGTSQPMNNAGPLQMKKITLQLDFFCVGVLNAKSAYSSHPYGVTVICVVVINKWTQPLYPVFLGQNATNNAIMWGCQTLLERTRPLRGEFCPKLQQRHWLLN